MSRDRVSSGEINRRMMLVRRLFAFEVRELWLKRMFVSFWPRVGRKCAGHTSKSVPRHPKGHTLHVTRREQQLLDGERCRLLEDERTPSPTQTFSGFEALAAFDFYNMHTLFDRLLRLLLYSKSFVCALSVLFLLLAVRAHRWNSCCGCIY